MRPLIAISCYVERARWGDWDEAAAVLPLTYVKAVEEAGGQPVILPPAGDAVEELLEAFDGIVLAGGADIDPQAYGSDRHPDTTRIRPDRDRFELALTERALDRDLPVLGICRGMQLLNVVRGGDLDQDLAPREGKDRHKGGPGVFARHDVEIASGSMLCSILGDRALVPSYHHQAPKRLGAGLRRVAWAPDGVTEGIEDPKARLLLGVLWHPETGEDRALFEALVQKASDYRKERR